jgi:dipeptide transport system substrate-binding protein
MSTKSLIAAAAIAAMIGLGPACRAKTLVYCSEASPTGFNPAISISTTGADVMRPLFNRLVEFERGSTRIVPALAESWDITADGTVYTFHLRHGTKFHTTPYFTPSREMNADDVIYSFGRQWKADYPDYALGAGQYESFDSIGMAKLLKSIDRVDDYTVRFALDRPEAPLLANLALIWGSVLSAEYAANNRAAGDPGKTDREPVGTGPYILQSYTKDATAPFKRYRKRATSPAIQSREAGSCLGRNSPYRGECGNAWNWRNCVIRWATGMNRFHPISAVRGSEAVKRRPLQNVFIGVSWAIA